MERRRSLATPSPCEMSWQEYFTSANAAAAAVAAATTSNKDDKLQRMPSGAVVSPPCLGRSPRLKERGKSYKLTIGIVSCSIVFFHVAIFACVFYFRVQNFPWLCKGEFLF